MLNSKRINCICVSDFSSETLQKKPLGFAQPPAVLTLQGTAAQVRGAADTVSPAMLSQLKLP